VWLGPKVPRTCEPIPANLVVARVGNGIRRGAPRFCAPPGIHKGDPAGLLRSDGFSKQGDKCTWNRRVASARWPQDERIVRLFTPGHCAYRGSPQINSTPSCRRTVRFARPNNPDSTRLGGYCAFSRDGDRRSRSTHQGNRMTGGAVTVSTQGELTKRAPIYSTEAQCKPYRI
jgi:hypothetical protein